MTDLRNLYAARVSGGLSQSGAEYVEPAAGYRAYIWAIVNADPTNGRAISFPEADGLGDIKMGPASTLAFPVPLICSKFQVQHAELTVIWREHD